MTQLLINNFNRGWQNRASHELMKAQALFVAKDISTEALGAITCRRLNRENDYFSGITANAEVQNYYHVDVEGTDKRLRYYIVGNALYRWNSLTNVTNPISLAMVAGTHVSYAAMRPVLSASTHVYVTDGTTMLSDDGTLTKSWGIDSPDGSVSLSLGTVTGELSAGDYKYVYTFYDADTGSESDPSPATAALTVGANGSVTVGSLAKSNLSRVTSRRIYRTIAGGGTYYLVATIPDNVTTSYTDTIADSKLTVEAEMDQGIPPDGDVVLMFGGRLFLAGNPDYPQRLYYTPPNRPDNWPSTYYVETESVDDRILNIVRFAGKLYAVQGAGISTLLGSDETNFDMYNTRSHIGTVARWSVASGPDGIYFVGSDGIYWFNGLKSSRVSDPISRIFNKTPNSLYDIVNMDQVASVARGAFLNGVYYLILPMLGSDGVTTNKLLTYDTLERAGEDVGTWLLHNQPLNDVFTDGGRGRAYGAKETSSGAGTYSVYNLMEYASSDVDTPEPEVVTKEFDIITPTSFTLSSAGLGSQRRGDVTELITKFRIDADGDWTLTFYLDKREVYSIELTDLSASTKYLWRKFPDELKGGTLYVKAVGTGSPRPDSHQLRTIEVR